MSAQEQVVKKEHVKVKVGDLTVKTLTWAVAKCENLPSSMNLIEQDLAVGQYFFPVTDWAHGGPIIERENINISSIPGLATEWCAEGQDGTFTLGDTPLVAAMRCYVASKMGETIDIPKDISCL